VTVVATKDKLLHLRTHGLANVEAKKPMQRNTLFWIASVTKPVTAVAVLILQDEGKLKVSDQVAKYVPEFANLKTPSGKPANLTIAQILTHTSGLSKAPATAAQKAHALAWIDPHQGVTYNLMVQRSNFPNSDASDVRKAFQQAAADALAKK
jgi:CubicO group peptidase (beta-lactamase class C family)